MKNQYNNKKQRHGYWESYYCYTDERIAENGYFINGVLIGLWKYYNDYGNITELEFYSQ